MSSAGEGEGGGGLKANEERVQFDLSRIEALVLFELLADFNGQNSIEVPSAAERLAVLRLHGALERTLVDPFCSDYKARLKKAQDQLRREFGEVHSSE